MKKRLCFLFLLFICFVFLPTSVLAKNIDHFYAQADDSITFEDSVEGSSALAGESIDFKGIVKGANFVAGNKIVHSGQSDYLIMAGNSISVDGVVYNDVAIAGNIINISSGADLHRDVVIFGSDIEIKGNLNRNVSIYGGKVVFKGASVGGSVKVFAEEVIVDNDTLISGKLSYPENAKASINPNITNVVKTRSMAKDEDDVMDLITDKVWSFLSILLPQLLPQCSHRALQREPFQEERRL